MWRLVAVLRLNKIKRIRKWSENRAERQRKKQKEWIQRNKGYIKEHTHKTTSTEERENKRRITRSKVIYKKMKYQLKDNKM